MVEKVLGLPRSSHEPLSDSQERQRRQLDLRVKLIAAQARVEITTEEYARLAALCSASVDNSSDSRQALRQAMAIRNSAFEEYSKALREWDEFLLCAMSDARRD
jgi:hypothetical protein